ncbi:hypothetical protein B4144_0355 [Bacillus atrophaeus]|nr:hypothetical protein B4144_0355 [Bacillus atrophaeus]
MLIRRLLNKRYQLLIPYKAVLFTFVHALFGRNAAREHAWLFKLSQALAPIAFRFFIVLLSEPFNIVGVRLALSIDSRASRAERFIVLEQAFHEHSHTPAVHHNMMIAPDKMQMIRIQPENRHFKQGILRQIKALLLHVLFITVKTIFLTLGV